MEALAQAFPRSGAAPATGPPASTEDSPLHRHLRPHTHPLASPDGFFLRAELMHDYLRDAEREPGAARAWAGEPLMARSHGEQFLMVLRQRFAEVGVYFLDEPESALSFRSWRDFLTAPSRYLQHLLGHDTDPATQR